MRCPKCGYISFDDLEVCKKCRKNIAGTMRELGGGVYHLGSPLFFRVSEPRTEGNPHSETSDMAGDKREDVDTEFVLDDIVLDEVSTSASGRQGGDDAGEEIMLDMDGLSMASSKDEFTLDLDADYERGEIKRPAIDFSGMDISDLAPPIVERPQPPEHKKEAGLTAANVDAAVPTLQSRPPAALEDLQLNDLNLDMPNKVVTSNVAGKRSLSSVKTGTALDMFEVDLGELFAEAKK